MRRNCELQENHCHGLAWDRTGSLCNLTAILKKATFPRQMKNRTIAGCVTLAFLSCIAFCWVTDYSPRGCNCNLQVDKNKNKVKQELTALPRLNVNMIKNCDAFNELRDVDFVDPILQDRLCTDSPAYTLRRGRFPLCQLNNHLPKLIYETVNKTAGIATVQRAMTSQHMHVYTFSEQDLISRQMLQSDHLETGQVSEIIKILKKFPKDSVTFLDIGSNLGLYSLQAREEGFPVIAIDANIRTLIRMQMTARGLGILDDRLKLFWCFLDEEVALKRISWVALTDWCLMVIGGASSGSTDWDWTKREMDTIPVMTARADDLIPHIKTKKVIIKMDIESGVHMFMRTGVNLFKEFDVLVLQMEFWRRPGTAPQTSPFYKFITEFMTSRNFSLISVGSHRVLNVATFNEWDGMWVRNDFLKEVARL